MKKEKLTLNYRLEVFAGCITESTVTCSNI